MWWPWLGISLYILKPRHKHTHTHTHIHTHMQMWWPWLGISLYMITALLVPYIEKRRWESIPRQNEESSRLFTPTDQDRMWDDASNWKLGLFYYCTEDPRVIVPKRLGVGWTVNLASFTGQTLCVGLVVCVVVSVLISLICAADPRGCGGF